MILRARWIVPVTAPPIRDGFIKTRGDLIGDLGVYDPLAHRGEDVIDLGDAILTPGLVNPHTHLELTCYAGKLPRASFWTWVGRLVLLRSMPGQVEREQRAVRDGAWQSLRAGVTCVGDISRRNLAWDVLKEVPVRKVCFVELLSIAGEPPRNVAELREAVRAVEEDDLLTVGVSPHAPYSVPETHIRGSIRLATELGRPWCTHWAETAEEVAFVHGDAKALPVFIRPLMSRIGLHTPELSPIAYLARCVGDGAPGALAHVNYIAGDEEIESLADAGHVVMYCPRAHRFFGHPPHAFSRLIRGGVPVAIGTDSAASNDDLSILAELRALKGGSSADVRNGQPEMRQASTDELGPVSPPPQGVGHPELTAHDLLRMATLEGARALGLADKIGSLETDKQADLAAFPCQSNTSDPVGDLIALAPAPVGVWIAGQRVAIV